MTDEELKSYEDKLLELKVSMGNLNSQIRKLLEDDNVKKYIHIEKEYRKSIKKEITLENIILEEQQKRCPHPAWYFASKITRNGYF